ncbi:RNA polymerase sigma factor [Nocardioides sp.]|uniref:RNA polymerase sigma factor n=1 Tax=Nocardioides sp. TaxID=35761 RepID=UPI00286CA67E|nr:RNA polymerase sigma factor [Nocardioides sp.]
MSERQERFRRLYAGQFDPLLGYALRRADRPEDAADVVADTFLVAWRRLDDVPDGDEARLWLYGVARRTLANHRRGDGRRSALGERLRQDLASAVPDHAPAVTEQETVRAALLRLADRDREVLELAAWEGLEPREIAEVLGISPIAVRSRLSRSRARLRAVMSEAGNDVASPGHVPNRHSQLVRQEDR